MRRVLATSIGTPIEKQERSDLSVRVPMIARLLLIPPAADGHEYMTHGLKAHDTLDRFALVDSAAPMS
jgi:hypothetical protein